MTSVFVAAIVVALPHCRRPPAAPAGQPAAWSAERVIRDKPLFVRCGDEKREAWKISGHDPSVITLPLMRGSDSIDLSVCTDEIGAMTALTLDAADAQAKKVSGWDAPYDINVPYGSWGTATVAVDPAVIPKTGAQLSLRVSPRSAPGNPRFVYVAAHARSQPPKGKPNILLISIDTLRADRMSSYGHRLQTSLNFENLSHGGTVFTNAIVQAASTPPSHASMLTGCYPSRTGLFVTKEVGSSYDNPDFRLNDRVVTLAEVLRANGYQTAATTGGGFLGSGFGFARGFDVFAEDNTTRPSEIMRGVDRVLKWLNAPARAPWFIFLHTYAVHRGPSGYEHRSYEALPLLDNMYPGRGTDAVAKAYNARYDSGVLFADVILGAIFDDLYFTQHLGDTIVVVTSDHGETLDERLAQAGYSYNHGYAFYDELVRVPLLIRTPQFAPAHARVDRPVEEVDIVPTILELAGVKHPTGRIDGKSLVGLMKGTGGYDKEAAFIESSPGGPFRAAVRNERYKYVRVLDWRPSFGNDYGMKKPPEEELYDLARDPQERNNLAASPGMAAVKADLRRRLETLVAHAGTMDVIRGAQNRR